MLCIFSVVANCYFFPWYGREARAERENKEKKAFTAGMGGLHRVQDLLEAHKEEVGFYSIWQGLECERVGGVMYWQLIGGVLAHGKKREV